VNDVAVHGTMWGIPAGTMPGICRSMCVNAYRRGGGRGHRSLVGIAGSSLECLKNCHRQVEGCYVPCNLGRNACMPVSGGECVWAGMGNSQVGKMEGM